MNNKQRKEMISNAIKYMTNTEGFELVSGKWGDVDEKCGCALTCLLASMDKEVEPGDGGENCSSNEEIAAELLKVDDKWITLFIAGFDDYDGEIEKNADKEAVENTLTGEQYEVKGSLPFKIGKEIRLQFNPSYEE